MSKDIVKMNETQVPTLLRNSIPPQSVRSVRRSLTHCQIPTSEIVASALGYCTSSSTLHKSRSDLRSRVISKPDITKQKQVISSPFESNDSLAREKATTRDPTQISSEKLYCRSTKNALESYPATNSPDCIISKSKYYKTDVNNTNSATFRTSPMFSAESSATTTVESPNHPALNFRRQKLSYISKGFAQNKKQSHLTNCKSDVTKKRSIYKGLNPTSPLSMRGVIESATQRYKNITSKSFGATGISSEIENRFLRTHRKINNGSFTDTKKIRENSAISVARQKGISQARQAVLHLKEKLEDYNESSTTRIESLEASILAADFQMQTENAASYVQRISMYHQRQFEKDEMQESNKMQESNNRLNRSTPSVYNQLSDRRNPNVKKDDIHNAKPIYISSDKTTKSMQKHAWYDDLSPTDNKYVLELRAKLTVDPNVVNTPQENNDCIQEKIQTREKIEYDSCDDALETKKIIDCIVNEIIGYIENSSLGIATNPNPNSSLGIAVNLSETENKSKSYEEKKYLDDDPNYNIINVNEDESMTPMNEKCDTEVDIENVTKSKKINATKSKKINREKKHETEQEKTLKAARLMKLRLQLMRLENLQKEANALPLLLRN